MSKREVALAIIRREWAENGKDTIHRRGEMIEDLEGQCKSCKKIFDLLHELYGKDYEPGRCPLCGGYLKRVVR